MDYKIILYVPISTRTQFIFMKLILSEFEVLKLTLKVYNSIKDLNSLHVHIKHLRKECNR